VLNEFETDGVVTETPVPVLTPTEGYFGHLQEERLKSKNVLRPPSTELGPIPIPIPPILLPTGARVLILKQDPVVKDIGIRMVFLPGRIFAGPKDARIAIQGMLTPNVFGDLIIDQAANPDGFDTAHTFAVVRMVLTMYQRQRGGITIPWQWNSPSNTDPLQVFPHAGLTQNAFYSRGSKALKFFFFDTSSPPPAHRVFTCRSLDIVAHETGHAILDGLKPGWLNVGSPPQTGGLHESFGDLTAIFLALSQLDQVEAIIAVTKANLHAKNFLSDLAEQFGLALGRPNGLRNADNDLKLSQVGTEVHAISQVFTGGVYDVLADLFALERDTAKKDDARVLLDVGQYVAGLVLRALIAAPNVNATYHDVVTKMIQIVAADGKPVAYKNAIVNRFTLREVLAPTATELAAHEGVEFAPGVVDEPEALQDRRGCCGTMQLDEYFGDGDTLEAEIERFRQELASGTEKGTRSKSSATKSKPKSRA
jgi:hypothetical protein